ncbi:MAG: exo-alpha-sialidase, partial [candidate division Zixibacteria bacterium]|nr:exo-alpha-sialidase [candidate division Zixibacteria bacterium]
MRHTKFVTVFSPIAFMISFLAGACSTMEKSDARKSNITEIDSPAQPGSAEPNLTQGDDGKIYLSWVEKQDDGSQALKFSRWSDSAWSEPGEIARGADWFVNWADFPTLGVTKTGTMMASWLKKSGPDTYSYDVNFSLSTNNGKSWSDPFVLHSDGIEAEHGFVSIAPI